MANEFVARNGVIALNNSQVTGSLSVTQGITGSLFGTASWSSNALTSSNLSGGTANYVPLWNGATSLSSSVMYQSGSNIGIGTTSPTGKLTVEGTAGTEIISIGSPVQKLYFWPDSSGVTISTATSQGGEGIYFGNSSDFMYFQTAATERMRITSVGNVGIGTTTPIDKLQVVATSYNGITITTNDVSTLKMRSTSGLTTSWGLATTNLATSDFGIYQSNANGGDPISAGTARLYFSSSGNVGIGTTSPNAKLDVNGNAIITGSLTVTDTITAQRLVVQTVSSSVSFVTGSTRFGSLLTNTHEFTGSVSMTGSLSVMGGNVGIGTTSPLTILDVASSANGYQTLRSTGTGEAMTFYQNTNTGTTSGDGLMVGINGTGVGYIYNWENQAILFGTNATERMRITSAGNVGIGTTADNPLGSGGTYRNLMVGNGAGYGAFQGVSTATAAGSTVAVFSGGTTGASSAFKTAGFITVDLDGTSTTNAVGRITFNVSQPVGAYVEAMRITSAGNVGIGTTTPSARLHVSGSTTTNLLVGTSDLFVSASGNVGIGTTTPIEKLQVAGNISIVGAGNYIDFQNGDVRFVNSTGNLSIQTYSVATALSTKIYVSGSGNVGVGTTIPTHRLSVSRPTEAAAYQININNDGGITTGNYTGIRFSQASDASTELGNIRLSYFNNGSTALSLGTRYVTQSIYIDNTTAGNIGIGTTSPAAAFTGTARVLHVYDSTNNNAGILRLEAGNTNVYGELYASTSQIGFYGGTAHPMLFWTNGTEKVRITAAGNVGIGTTSPSARLHVSGSTTTNLLVGNSDLFVSASGNVGIGTTSPGATLEVRRTDTQNQQLVLSNNGTYHTGLIGTSTTTPLSDNNAWGLFGGPNTYVTGISNSAMIVGGSGVPGIGFRFTTSNLNSGAGTTVLYASASGNVGINTTTPSYKLDISGSTRITDYLIQGSIKEYVIQSLSANATQAREYEILRGIFDFNDWSSVGPVEIEIHERYYSRGLLKKYTFSYGYYDTGNLRLVEMLGDGENNFQLVLGTKTLISGDIYYFPVKLQVRYYTQVDVYIRTRRNITTNSTSTNPGDLYINTSPSPTNISDFTADSTVYINTNASNNYIAGNIGIGTSSPATKLDVNGIVRASTTDQSTNRFRLYNQNSGQTWDIVGGLNGANNTDFSIYDGSSTRFVIVSGSGNVGIGTTSPAAKLDVNGDVYVRNTFSLLTDKIAPFSGANIDIKYGATSYFTVTENVTERFRITSGGNVGIGTASPAQALHIARTAAVSPTIRLQTTDSTSNGGIQFSNSANSTLAYIGSNTNVTDGAGGLEFGAGGTTTRMFISSSGNVGINTTSPSYKLDVGGAIRATGILYSDNGSFVGTLNLGQIVSIKSSFGSYADLLFTLHNGGGFSDIMKLQGNGNVGIGTTSPAYTLDLSTSNDGRARQWIADVAFLASGNASAGFQVRTINSTTAGVRFVNYANNTEWMRIDASGNVGIGTTSPNAKLDVNGNTIVTGSLNVTAGITGSLFGTSSWAVSASWAPGGSAPTAVTFNRVTGSYTFVLADAGKTIEVSASAAGTYTLTVPSSSVANFANGTYMDVLLYGTGSLQFTTGSTNVNIRSANNWLKMGTRYGAATLIKISGDEWYLVGNING